MSSTVGAAISSIGSPSTLNILPRTFGHTGTEIGFSVAITSNHLLSHSTGFIAIVRTILSPSCCWTSRISLSGAHTTSSASYIFGIYQLLNSTSITTQIILVITHLFIVLNS